MNYSTLIDDYTLIFKSMFDLKELLASSPYEHIDLDDTEITLETISQVAQSTLDPLQRSSDLHPAELVNGIVQTPPGFENGYKTLAELGVMGMTAETKYGGSGFPYLVQNAVNEMINGACISLCLNPLLTQSQIEALQKFASEPIKELVIPKLVSGEWYGTMNITEAQAGSDVSGIQTEAKLGHDQKYRVTGQKIYISWGDADFVKNVCHLVLARVPDAPKGTKGLSLFLVLKYLEDAQGNFTKLNRLKVLSLEKKLGLHGSPTATMYFDSAEALLIGQPNKGLEAMFAMMNSARLGVGSQGLGVAEAAFQKAKAYALDRQQGSVNGQPQVIIQHPDIQRMLAIMRVQIFSARAICSACAYALDKAKMKNEKYWHDRAALLTPIAKFYGSETGVEVSNLAIRIFGGIGYIEATGMTQYLRDSLVTTIYEGTNGIQAHDLVIRKLGKNGEILFNILSEVEAFCQNTPELSNQYVEELERAGTEIAHTTQWIIKQVNSFEVKAGAQAYMRALATYLGSFYHLQRYHFFTANEKQMDLLEVCFSRFLPYVYPLCTEVKAGHSGLEEFVSTL